MEPYRLGFLFVLLIVFSVVIFVHKDCSIHPFENHSHLPALTKLSTVAELPSLPPPM